VFVFYRADRYLVGYYKNGGKDKYYSSKPNPLYLFFKACKGLKQFIFEGEYLTLCPVAFFVAINYTFPAFFALYLF